MASPNLMGLVRELKALNAKKKSGQALNDEEKKRRKELKTYLKTALEEQKGSGGSAERTDTKSRPSRGMMSATGTSGSGSPVRAPASSGSGSPVAAAQPASPSPVATPAAVVQAAVVQAAVTPAAVEAVPAPVTPAPVAAASEAPAPEAAPAAPVGQPKRRGGYANAFAINAGGLLDEAEQSKAVAATHKMEKGPGAMGAASAGEQGPSVPDGGSIDLSAPLAGFKPQGKASAADIDDMVARSDAATRATKARERVKAPDEVGEQLSEIAAESAYTEQDKDDLFQLEDYFGGYFEEGYDYLDDDGESELSPIDPREIELHKVGLGASSTGGVEAGSVTISVPASLAFADDFPALYTTGVLPKPEDDEEPDLDDPDLLIPGRRKVTVHLLSGATRRGVIRLLRKGDLGFTLEPLGSGKSEEMSISQLKAVFIQKPSRAEPIPATGQVITVTFRDRRKIQGATVDYQPGAPVFTLIPSKGQFERIIVNGAAVTAVQ